MTPRIVSLLPSATEIICALGFRDALVGRSHECDFPADVESVPVVTRTQIRAEGTSAEIHASVSSLTEHRTSVYDLDERLLRELAPTHIVTQIVCEVCAVSVHDVHRSLYHWGAVQPEVISLGGVTLDGVLADIEKAAGALGAGPTGSALVQSLRARVRRIARRLSRNPRAVVPIAGLEWLDPLMGTGNWMPELIAAAGGRDLFSKIGVHARWLSWDEVRRAQPQKIILFPCGFSIKKTMAELARGVFPADEALVADGNSFFNRPGPRLVETTEILAEMMHPELFAFGHRQKSWTEWRSSPVADI